MYPTTAAHVKPGATSLVVSRVMEGHPHLLQVAHSQNVRGLLRYHVCWYPKCDPVIDFSGYGRDPQCLLPPCELVKPVKLSALAQCGRLRDTSELVTPARRKAVDATGGASWGLYGQNAILAHIRAC